MSSTTSQPMLSFPRETFAKLSPHPYLLAHLNPSSNGPSQRANGRSPAEFRTPHINNGSLTHAEGSAVVRTGDTTVVCGVRGEILRASDIPEYRIDRGHSAIPGYNEAKELDLLVPNIEIATGCSPAFLPGQPPSMLAQSLSTRLYTLLHSSKLVDVEDLKIWYHPEKLAAKDTEGDEEMESEDGLEEAQSEVKAFWTLYIDILFISLDGNPFDAAWAAVVSALRDVRLPKAYWDVDREIVLCSDGIEDARALQLRGLPISTTFAVFKAQQHVQGQAGKDYWVLGDPDDFEEGLCDETVTIVVDASQASNVKLLGISKSGGTAIDRKHLGELVKVSEKRWQEWQKLITNSSKT